MKNHFIALVLMALNLNAFAQPGAPQASGTVNLTVIEEIVLPGETPTGKHPGGIMFLSGDAAQLLYDQMTNVPVVVSGLGEKVKRGSEGFGCWIHPVKNVAYCEFDFKDITLGQIGR